MAHLSLRAPKTGALAMTTVKAVSSRHSQEHRNGKHAQYGGEDDGSAAGAAVNAFLGAQNQGHIADGHTEHHHADRDQRPVPCDQPQQRQQGKGQEQQLHSREDVQPWLTEYFPQIGMGQGESHRYQSHGRGYIAQIGDGGFQEARKLYSAYNDQQSGEAGHSAGIDHGLQGGERKLSVHQRHAVGVEHNGVNQQKFRHIDHIFLPQDTGNHRDADEPQVREDEHLLENFPLLGRFVEKGRQHHAHRDKDRKHAQSNDAHKADGAQGYLTRRIGGTGQNQHGIEHIDDHFGHLGVGMAVQHVLFCHEIACADHDQQRQHLKKYGNYSHIPLAFLIFF